VLVRTCHGWGVAWVGGVAQWWSTCLARSCSSLNTTENKTKNKRRAPCPVNPGQQLEKSEQTTHRASEMHPQGKSELWIPSEVGKPRLAGGKAVTSWVLGPRPGPWDMESFRRM
jgi:hypothetical protein